MLVKGFCTAYLIDVGNKIDHKVCTQTLRNIRKDQARRQDSVTEGGAEINFEGAREVYLCEFERSTGAQFILVWIKRIR